MTSSTHCVMRCSHCCDDQWCVWGLTGLFGFHKIKRSDGQSHLSRGGLTFTFCIKHYQAWRRRKTEDSAGGVTLEEPESSFVLFLCVMKVHAGALQARVFCSQLIRISMRAPPPLRSPPPPSHQDNTGLGTKSRVLLCSAVDICFQAREHVHRVFPIVHMIPRWRFILVGIDVSFCQRRLSFLPVNKSRQR